MPPPGQTGQGTLVRRLLPKDVDSGTRTWIGNADKSTLPLEMPISGGRQGLNSHSLARGGIKRIKPGQDFVLEVPNRRPNNWLYLTF
jgi:hypothetical protein